MFFVLSKMLWIATAPATVLLALVLLGLLLCRSARTGRARFGYRLAATGAILLLVVGALPIGTLVVRPLEDRFPQVPADAPAPTGIVVLGGSTNEAVAAARGRTTIQTSAERVTEAVILARRYPDARLVFSGGSSDLAGIKETEAEDTRRQWIAMGVAPERITIEARSRNTDENARFTKALVQPKPGERWWLLTSAFHMPRSVGLFRANDFPVLAYPVDFRSAGTIVDFGNLLAISDNLQKLDFAVHEWVGLVAYRLTGKTRELFPGPEPLETHSAAR